MVHLSLLEAMQQRGVEFCIYSSLADDRSSCTSLSGRNRCKNTTGTRCSGIFVLQTSGLLESKVAAEASLINVDCKSIDFIVKRKPESQRWWFCPLEFNSWGSVKQISMDASSVLIFQCLLKKNQSASRHRLLIVYSILYTATSVHDSLYIYSTCVWPFSFVFKHT